MKDNQNTPARYTNLSYLKESSANNEAFVKEMVSIFLRQTPEFLDALELQLQNKNILEFRQVLHKLKPTISFMGIAVLEGTVRRMEKAAKETLDYDELAAGVKEMKAVCAFANKELETL